VRESVTAIIKCGAEVLLVKRSPALRDFPGYYSFPGGKVDDCDKNSDALTAQFEDITKNFPLKQQHLNACLREIEEELGVTLDVGHCQIYYLGYSSTPSFQPVRFKNYYLLLELDKKPGPIKLSSEIEAFEWIAPEAFTQAFARGDYLMVPPSVRLMQELCGQSKSYPQAVCFDLVWDDNLEVPCIEAVAGILQYMPLSNTFPPANRTTAFFLGDDGHEILVDPSPKDKSEYSKLKYSLRQRKIAKMLITHHHPDHHENAIALALDWKIPVLMSQITLDFLNAKYGIEYVAGVKIQIISQGEILTYSKGHKVIVYHVPGHDEGQLAFAREDGAWFVAGDLIQTVGTVVIGGAEGDMAKYFESLERVIALNPRVVFPSHGIAMGGVNQLQKTLEHRKLREQQVLKLAVGGCDQEEIFSTIYPDLAPSLKKYALKTIECHMKKLKQEGLIKG